MKKIYWAFLLLMAGSQMQCTNLDEHVFSSIPADEFFKNEEEVIMSVGRIYTNMVGYSHYYNIWGTMSVSSDEALSPQRQGNQWLDGGVWRDLHAHTWTPQHDNIRQTWEFIFTNITLCNSIKLQLEQSKVEFPTKANLMAEVMVVRAWWYLNAMDLFGNVPYAVDFSDPELPKQVGRDQIFTLIETDIKNNVDKLYDAPTASNYGRATKAFAYTVLAKLYLNAQEWIGTAKWQETIDACNKVLSYPSLMLEPDYFTNFKANNDKVSRENIFVVIYDKVYTSKNWANLFRFHQLTLYDASAKAMGIVDYCWNGFCASESFYNSYSAGDYRRKQWLEGLQYKPDGSTVILRGTTQLDYTPFITSLYDGTNPAKTNEGVRSVKYEYVSGLTGELMDNDYVVYRLADVIMMKGEALVRQGKANDALPLFNQIRSRAKMPDYTTADLTLDEIFNERGREFAWEGLRRQDRIRFGKWQEAWKFKAAEADGHTKLFPIPATALLTNGNLKQNPGYTD